MKKFKGLTSAEVQASKNAHGDNRLSSKEANSLLSIFIEAFQDQWILILLAALGLKIIFNFVGMIFPAIGEANWYEAISLIFAILMSTGFSAVSQYRNEQKFNTLQEEASKTNAKVYRDGKLKEILVDDIVKGDQILLQSGDKIPVDGIILEGELKVKMLKNFLLVIKQSLILQTSLQSSKSSVVQLLLQVKPLWKLHKLVIIPF